MKGFKAAGIFVVCLWVVVVTTYAGSVSNDWLLHKTFKAHPMDDSSCSSSSSSGSPE